MNLKPLVCSALVAAMSFAAPSAFGNENIAVSAVSQDSSPIAGPEENASCQSLPNICFRVSWRVEEGTLKAIRYDKTISSISL
ncbi:MAG: hypothetical protein IJO38_06870 [Akkermansia sp.]|nr:hypothetical protein [Akkermansia sp.]